MIQQLNKHLQVNSVPARACTWPVKAILFLFSMWWSICCTLPYVSIHILQHPHHQPGIHVVLGTRSSSLQLSQGSMACNAMLAPAVLHILLAGAGQTELPTCPVCLERLDEHISGVVTTVRVYLCTEIQYGASMQCVFQKWTSTIGDRCLQLCRDPIMHFRSTMEQNMQSKALQACSVQVCNHRFHNECLQRWGDTKCPVCRYCAQASSTTSHCTVCATSQVCLTCRITYCAVLVRHVCCITGNPMHPLMQSNMDLHCVCLQHAFALDLV